jgi:hypothetical protein
MCTSFGNFSKDLDTDALASALCEGLGEPEENLPAVVEVSHSQWCCVVLM